jgi:hypothetical protein
VEVSPPRPRCSRGRQPPRRYPREVPVEPGTETEETDSAAAAATDVAPGTEETRLSKLSIPELQALYLDVVGRPTSSIHRRYLQWKVTQARKGRIPVGPRGNRRTDGDAVDFKVLPLRMEAELVNRLDEARERLGLKSRMDLFRRALHAFLGGQGEAEVAALFAPEV